MAVVIGAIGLAASIGGSMMSAQGSAQSAKAQYEQQRINQQWAEFEKQMQLTQQRGAMGLQEFDRLFGNAMLERESLEQQVFASRAYRDQSQYNTSQLVRASRQAQARQNSTMASRGMGRGGTSEAIKNQARTDMMNDLGRIRVNDTYQLAAIENQRNQMLKQRNMRPTNQPPTYIPATPVQPPNTSGMLMGAMLGGLASGIGGLAGAFSAGQSGGPSAQQVGQMQGMMASGYNPSTVAALNLAG